MDASQYFNKVEVQEQLPWSYLVIIRGVPGSGKTTLACSIADTRISMTTTSADDFFTHNRQYRFDKEWISTAHSYCRSVADRALFHKRAAIVHNTNIEKWEVEESINIGVRHNVPVLVITLTKEYGSTHDVAESTMERMRERLYPSEQIVAPTGYCVTARVTGDDFESVLMKPQPKQILNQTPIAV